LLKVHEKLNLNHASNSKLMDEKNMVERNSTKGD